MVCMGHIEGGTVVLDEPANFPDGAMVRVELAEADFLTKVDGNERPSFCEIFAPIIGKAKNLPPDAAENHDHYLYGTPKR